MAIKKSELYSSIWAACDGLRNGMEPSEYKDYVLFMLFIKYVSDKYAESDDFRPPVVIPKGASFADMVAMKGHSDIGNRINVEIVQPIIDANNRQLARADFPDFNDPKKLGDGKTMVDTLTGLIAIFEKPELDFSRNRADNDDILGDAYEYLMRHFAVESGKSKGQFYTPAEVSRVIAEVIGISRENSIGATSVYDPTCGSGSLLLKVAAKAGKEITLEGQEMGPTTAGLARMNMILHGFTTARIEQGNTLATPKFKDGEKLRTYDYVVANPPFSAKTWTAGLTPANDPYQRFIWGVPPPKQGDYAFLLHIIRSMKAAGKAACILPHGVLFRGNAEAVIRKELIRSGYLKAVIGLPANLFYGTGIPACVLVLDKENATARKGVFMVDASKGFIKDGNKNRLRERDVHKIVDAVSRLADLPRYSRLVPLDEIANPKNDYNLNLPRYIDTTEPEDLQDIDGHLRGGIPERDIEALADYWKVLPSLRAVLFESAGRPGYVRLKLPLSEVRAAILCHPEFTAFNQTATHRFAEWRATAAQQLTAFDKGGHPKELIKRIAEDLLVVFREAPLLDAYAVYQHLMDYWAETLQDDTYLIAADGWVAKTSRVLETDKKGKTKDKGWTCELIPKSLIVAHYFADAQQALDKANAELEEATAGIAALEEENGGEEGCLGALDKIAKGEVNSRLKEIKSDQEAKEEVAVLKRWIELSETESSLKRAVKEHEAALDKLAYNKYSTLTNADIKALAIVDKWMASLAATVQGELERVSQTLTGRIRELAERYATPLPQLTDEVMKAAARVEEHLEKMGDLKQNAMQQLLTGKTRLPGFQENWRLTQLGELTEIISGGTPKTNESSYWNGDISWCTPTDITRFAGKYLIETERSISRAGLNNSGATMLPVGALLLCSRATIGEVKIAGVPVCTNQGFKSLVCRSGTSNEFLYYKLLTMKSEMIERAFGSTFLELSTRNVFAIEVSLPPFDEQIAIATVLSDIDNEMYALEARRDKTRALKQAMMQELLTGRTRLI